MRISKKLVALGAFFILVAVAVAGCGGSNSVGSNSVANVAGNPVSMKAWKHWTYIYAKAESAQYAQEGETLPAVVPDPPNYEACIKELKSSTSFASATDTLLKEDCEKVFAQSNATIMPFLIGGYWYQALAHKLGIAPSDSEVKSKVEAELKSSFKTKAAQAAYLKQSGESLTDFEWQMRSELAYQALLKHFTKKVSASAVTAYYNHNPSKFVTPASRDAHVLRVTSKAKADAAYKALTSGTSWVTVVKKYEPGATTSNNGALVTNITDGSTSTLETVVRKAVFSAPVDKVIGPIKGAYGYYVIAVTKSNPSSKATLNAETRKQILSELTTAAGTAAKTELASQAKKNYGADTNCANGYGVKTYCANYGSSKPAPVKTTPAASGSASSGSASSGSSAKTTTSKK